MARTSIQPGPPPRHFRSPGVPPAAVGLPGVLAANPAMQPVPPRTGISGTAAGVLAVGTLILGLAFGIVIGRASAPDGSPAAAASPLTSPPTLPSSPGNTIAPNPPADPGTELPPQQVGTADNPIGAGSGYVIGLYTIEVRGFTADATQRVAEMSILNPPPAPGNQYVLVEIAITFNERDSFGSAAAIPFRVTDGAQSWDQYPPPCGIVDDDLLESGFISPGDTLVGNACFEVPSASVPSLVLTTEGFSGDIHFALPES